MKDEEIARVLKVGNATVERVLVEEGLERALGRKEQLAAGKNWTVREKRT